eukprot:1623847-Amphidinium_carterae.1
MLRKPHYVLIWLCWVSLGLNWHGVELSFGDCHALCSSQLGYRVCDDEPHSNMSCLTLYSSVLLQKSYFVSGFLTPSDHCPSLQLARSSPLLLTLLTSATQCLLRAAHCQVRVVANSPSLRRRVAIFPRMPSGVFREWASQLLRIG